MAATSTKYQWGEAVAPAAGPITIYEIPNISFDSAGLRPNPHIHLYSLMFLTFTLLNGCPVPRL